MSFETLVRDKAIRLGVPESDVVINYDDRSELSLILHDALLHSDATAGNLSFNEQGNRKITYITVRNFVPIEGNNFSVNTSRSLSPWVVQVRGTLTNNPDESTVFKFKFYNENGTYVEDDQSSIVFASGTTIPPLDQPFRPLGYRRGIIIMVHAIIENAC